MNRRHPASTDPAAPREIRRTAIEPLPRKHRRGEKIFVGRSGGGCLYSHRPYEKPRISFAMRTPVLPTKRSGFSLVEVALAIAVVSFAVIGILSLMSSGLGNYRQVMDTTIAAQIAQRIINDAEQSDFKNLTDVAGQKNNRQMQEMESGGKVFSFRAPKIQYPAFRYFDDQGKEIVSRNVDGMLDARQKFNAVYWVNVRIVPRAVLPGADRGRGTELAQLTVEVACNPNQVDLKGHVESKSDSERYNLFNAPSGIRVLTYSAYVGRNE